jgi:branched-chain amino acid aminotransferase
MKACGGVSGSHTKTGYPAIKTQKILINLEKYWVPRTLQTSLYIRPTIIAVDPFLGLRTSHTYRFYIILSPVGAYYAEGFNPIKIMACQDHVRAVPGGTGEAKTPGNYAASLFAGQKAKDGSVLSGITRDSVLQLAEMWSIKVSERKISIENVLEANESGRLQEVFGSGTAAVISPVGKIKYGDQEITINDMKVGPLTDRLFRAVTDIQYGKAEDPKGWIEPLWKKFDIINTLSRSASYLAIYFDHCSRCK